MRIVPEGVPDKVDGHQRGVDKQPGGPQLQRPQERHAAEVAQEQRRIAQRQQAATAVADGENEKDHRVADVLPLAVGLQQRADQQHGRPGGADEAGQHRARREERRIRRRVGPQVAFDANPAADRVEREQQGDEGNILAEQRVLDHGPGGRKLAPPGLDDTTWAAGK